MSYSIMSMGASTKNQAQQSLKTLSDLEANREAQNKNIKQQKKQSTLGGVGTGAMIGAQFGGPWGAVIGGVIGGIAGSL
ncbi:YMGG-like glycine zipper-containing protein [Parashewanella hymeniacidonis]|uniref:YMGG-like glycine zipper-containing protein n=1 Tax=Parashewanella hymeniacidonis TaxID=2807618 RepID=UPI001EF58277|nr:YMGG-like glycine zipper-containing protein [Parashewanella hymeniacidonis]